MTHSHVQSPIWAPRGMVSLGATPLGQLKRIWLMALKWEESEIRGFRGMNYQPIDPKKGTALGTIILQKIQVA